MTADSQGEARQAMTTGEAMTTAQATADEAGGHGGEAQRAATVERDARRLRFLAEVFYALGPAEFDFVVEHIGKPDKLTRKQRLYLRRICRRVSCGDGPNA